MFNILNKLFDILKSETLFYESLILSHAKNNHEI